MSRMRVSKTASTAINEDGKRKEWPVVAYLWAVGLALMSYAVARAGLAVFPHPYHWVSGLVGGVGGILIGWIWYRWRGDVL
jgi:hypothetical protein